MRITAYDFREKFTNTCIQLGKAQITVEELKSSGKKYTLFLRRIIFKLFIISLQFISPVRTRLKLESPNPEGRTAGFVTMTTWAFEQKLPGSTDSTPYHTSSAQHQGGACGGIKGLHNAERRLTGAVEADTVATRAMR